MGVDAGALRFPAGGVRRYAVELFSRVAALAPEIEFVAVDRSPGDPLPPGMTDGPRAAALPSNLGRAAALGWTIGRTRLDLFHAPAYTAPFTTVPVVLTVHDVSYARRPEFYAHRSGPLRQWFYRRSAARAAHIITDSAFSRDEISAAYAVPESRITVVPLGVGLPFTGAGGQATGMLPSGVRPPFVLHVGDLHRRRDLPTALQCVVEANRRRPVSSPPMQLVAVGADSGAVGALRQLSQDVGASGILVTPGPVDESALLALYRAAAAFVYPSLYEGFGLPVLEAMACGLPVIAANAGSVPEVVGEAGLLVPPGDVRAFTNALLAVVSDTSRQRELRAKGEARAATFSWDRTARETVAVYRGCLR